MKKRHVSTTTILEPYGLIRISGEVERDNDFDPHTEGILGSPWAISSLKVTDTDGDITDDLEAIELEKVHEVLIEKFLDEEQAHQDALIDAAIERGRELARHAYA